MPEVTCLISGDLKVVLTTNLTLSLYSSIKERNQERAKQVLPQRWKDSSKIEEKTSKEKRVAITTKRLGKL